MLSNVCIYYRTLEKIMQTYISLSKAKSKLPRVPIDDALMTVMLLNDQPIIAIAADVQGDRSHGSKRNGYCHLVRVDDVWAEA